MELNGKAYFPEGCPARGGLFECFDEGNVFVYFGDETLKDGINTESKLVIGIAQEDENGKEHFANDSVYDIVPTSSYEAFVYHMAAQRIENIASFICQSVRECSGPVVIDGIEQCGAFNLPNVRQELERYVEDI